MEEPPVDRRRLVRVGRGQRRERRVAGRVLPSRRGLVHGLCFLAAITHAQPQGGGGGGSSPGGGGGSSSSSCATDGSSSAYEEVLDVDAAPYAPPTPSPTAEGEKKKTKRRILGLPGQLALVLFAAAVALIGICGCWYACAGSGEEPERESSPDVELNDVYKQPKKTTREVV